jgi:hypothetical protein
MMDEAPLVDYPLARRAIDHHLPTIEPLIAHPKGQCL